jgi:hypothetical protein
VAGGNYNTTGILKGPSGPAANKADEASPEIVVTAAEISKLDALQMLLDVIGLVPGFGAPADILNAIISGARGDWLGAGLSLFGVVPVAGEAATAAKIAKNSEKYAAAVAKVADEVLPYLPARVQDKLRPALEAAQKKIDELSGKPPKKEPEPPPKAKGDSDEPGMKSKGTGRDCRLRKYKDGCAGGKTPHHVVPDRVFRMPGQDRPYAGGLAHGDGYSICVDGPTPIRKGARANEHGLIHAIYDPLEAALGAKGNPVGTASLGELEALGVAAAAKVTGCNPVRMAAELRVHHQTSGLSLGTKVRADPTGSMSRLLDPKLLGPGTTRGGMGGI